MSFTQESPSIIQQTDFTESASKTKGIDVPQIQMPDFSSILTTILGDETSADPVKDQPSASDTEITASLEPEKPKNTTVLNSIINPTPTTQSGKGLPSYSAFVQHITQKAIQLGIDPQVALTVAKHEGLQEGKNGSVANWQSLVKKAGMREPSYGPFQMLVGGPGTGYPIGLGNKFEQKTGLKASDPANAFATVDFALDYAKNNGWSAWYGAKAAGITGRQGIS